MFVVEHENKFIFHNIIDIIRIRQVSSLNPVSYYQSCGACEQVQLLRKLFMPFMFSWSSRLSRASVYLRDMRKLSTV